MARIGQIIKDVRQLGRILAPFVHHLCDELHRADDILPGDVGKVQKLPGDVGQRVASVAQSGIDFANCSGHGVECIVIAGVGFEHTCAQTVQRVPGRAGGVHDDFFRVAVSIGQVVDRRGDLLDGGRYAGRCKGLGDGFNCFSPGLAGLVRFVACLLGGLCQRVGGVAGLAVGGCQRFGSMARLLCGGFQLVKVFRAGCHDLLVVLHRGVGVKLGLCKFFEGFRCCIAGGFQFVLCFGRELFVLHEVIELVARFLDGRGQLVMDAGRCFDGLREFIGRLFAEGHHVVQVVQRGGGLDAHIDKLLRGVCGFHHGFIVAADRVRPVVGFLGCVVRCSIVFFEDACRPVQGRFNRACRG